MLETGTDPLEMSKCKLETAPKQASFRDGMRLKSKGPFTHMIALEKNNVLATANAAANHPQSVIPRWLKLPAAVAYSGIGRSTIYTLLNAGKVKSHRIGSSRVIDRESLDAFISSQPSTGS